MSPDLTPHENKSSKPTIAVNLKRKMIMACQSITLVNVTNTLLIIRAERRFEN